MLAERTPTRVPVAAFAVAVTVFGVQTLRDRPPVSAPSVAVSEPEVTSVHYVASVFENAPTLDEPIATEPPPHELPPHEPPPHEPPPHEPSPHEPPPHEPPPAFVVPAAGPCTRPTVQEQVALRRRIDAWIERRYTLDMEDGGSRIDVGCTSKRGVFVRVVADIKVQEGQPRISRWWALRVTPDWIVKLATATGPRELDWMEWTDEHSIESLGFVDIDRDGAHDFVFAYKNHEGGAIVAYYELVVATAKGRTKVVGRTVAALRDVAIGPHDVELLFEDEGGQTQRRCIDAGLTLGPCRR